MELRRGARCGTPGDLPLINDLDAFTSHLQGEMVHQLINHRELGAAERSRYDGTPDRTTFDVGGVNTYPVP